MTKLLNGDEDGPKVRAAERASGRFIGSYKLGDIQFIVRKTRDRISIHYLSPEWRSLDRIAKFASTIPTTGARYANSMGNRPKVRAAERASGRFIGSCPNSIYSVYVKEVGVAV
jgi:hypothetical protein